jgi:hypothetical protein
VRSPPAWVVLVGVLGAFAGALFVLYPSEIEDAPAGAERPKQPPVSVQEPSVPAPKVDLRRPAREGKTAVPIARTPHLERAYATLRRIVENHALDPGDAWAIAHGMLALGPDVTLPNGAMPIDFLFDRYANVVRVEGEDLVAFPPNEGVIRIEPHTDLLLKTITESGAGPERVVTVDERSFPLSALYRSSLREAWVAGKTTSFMDHGFNDAPWALQGLAAWAPRDLAWIAEGGREMTLAGFTHATTETLVEETRHLSDAKARGELVKKDTRAGIFRYTCGGQHLLQGAAYAVARGFGNAQDATRVCEQLDLLVWRIDVELGSIDPLMENAERPIRVVLLEQRLKFLGHFLETVHRIHATKTCNPQPHHLAASERAAAELAKTVEDVAALGIWDDLQAVRADTTLDQYRKGGREQVYLDFVGDAAHAVRGIDLATGRATLLY